MKYLERWVAVFLMKARLFAHLRLFIVGYGGRNSSGPLSVFFFGGDNSNLVGVLHLRCIFSTCKGRSV